MASFISIATYSKHISSKNHTLIPHTVISSEQRSKLSSYMLYIINVNILAKTKRKSKITQLIEIISHYSIRFGSTAPMQAARANAELSGVFGIEFDESKIAVGSFHT